MNRQHANERARARAARHEPSATTCRFGGTEPTSLWQELRLGAAVGLCACLLFAWALGAPAHAALVAAVGGLCAGGVIGVLLWIGSATLPEDPVLPPAPGQEREVRQRRR